MTTTTTRVRPVETKANGCQSESHDVTRCVGMPNGLWPCEECGRRVCLADGTDDQPDLCDHCWNENAGPL